MLGTLRHPEASSDFRAGTLTRITGRTPGAWTVRVEWRQVAPQGSASLTELLLPQEQLWLPFNPLSQQMTHPSWMRAPTEARKGMGVSGRGHSVGVDMAEGSRKGEEAGRPQC